MDIKNYFRNQPSEKLDDLQYEPARKSPKVDSTQMLESTTDDELRETADKKSVYNDNEKESEYILGEPAAPISPMQVNNDVPQL